MDIKKKEKKIDKIIYKNVTHVFSKKVYKSCSLLFPLRLRFCEMKFRIFLLPLLFVFLQPDYPRVGKYLKIVLVDKKIILKAAAAVYWVVQARLYRKNHSRLQLPCHIIAAS